MKLYQKLNNIIGWLVFTIAAMVYIITSEPTASFWDCGEYIATAFKLQVGHPPGAPLFQLIGRFFALFAFGDLSMVARMINTMSALVSGLTILFLFWSITHLSRKLVSDNDELSMGQIIAVLGSGAVGALAFTFCDSFWFSAVEGEVYAMSTFFTAIVFWAILKWERVADEPHSSRWLILIAYLVGLSIGVHLLNLLAIPAITFVYYFRKYNATPKGIIVVLILSILILATVMYAIIPWIVSFAGVFERVFVNSFGMPFNTGTIIYFLLLTGGIVWGLYYTHKKAKVVYNTIILAFLFILIGYSSFFMLVIRSNANPPIDENNPENAISLLAYLNREQYGDWPLFKGHYFNSPADPRQPAKDGKPVYTKDEEKGKYVITDERKNTIPNYDERFTTIFPRMWSSSQKIHANAYKSWGKIEGTPITVRKPGGGTEVIYKPKFSENLRYFFNYQIGHMYFRYFMWNFAGRQNDIQGHGGPLHGNWISGIPFIDNARSRLGPQENLPDELARNKGMNKFYMLPFILGLIGFMFHINKNYKDSIVVLLLFFLTGLAIIIYLNQYPYQPRERDYAFAASFMAFCIWIGIGALGIYNLLSKYINSKAAAVLVTLICLLLVPGIMAKDGWDDHDRSNRYTAIAVAKNYLESCKPNAIIFTNGDNDTFPLWYAQEVEDIRTDVRVVNLSLLNTDWYIDQMARKAYDSEAVPFSLTKKKYIQGTRDYIYFIDEPPNWRPGEKIPWPWNQYSLTEHNSLNSLKVLMEFIGSDDVRTKYASNRGNIEYFPTKKLRIPVDSSQIVNDSIVSPENAHLIVDNVDWTLDKYGVQKNHLMVLDLLSNFDWKRPVYFAITTGDASYIGLTEYFQLEGLAYRLVPIKYNSPDGQIGRIDTEIMYDNLINKFTWGNLGDPNVYLDETNMRMTMNFRNNFARLADALILEGKNEKALIVLDRCMEIMPEEAIPYNYFILQIAIGYYKIGKIEKGNAIVEKLIEIYDNNLKYYFSFRGDKAKLIDRDKQLGLDVLNRISQITRAYSQDSLNLQATDIYNSYRPPQNQPPPAMGQGQPTN
ncbi:MAG: DUF2723 domain-containing protein [Bacteroidetes bacterium]|nr:DUF2723 domain-containing protein [Bacteroidota bacterium]